MTRKKTHEEYVAELAEKNPTVEVVGKYIDALTKIAHHCLTHDVYWETTPSRALQGVGCKMCHSEKISASKYKTHEQYVEEVEKVNPNIIVLGVYINANTPILHKCLIDGNEWYIAPANALFGYGCPSCNESKGEKRIHKWFDSFNIVCERQKIFNDCKDKRPLPFDFYLPNYDCCIEYDGEQHYRSVDYFGGEEGFKKRVEHDKIKTQYCADNNIKLLRIPYFANVEKELNNFLFI